MDKLDVTASKKQEANSANTDKAFGIASLPSRNTTAMLVAAHLSLGAFQMIAADHAEGYAIFDRRWPSPQGEVDVAPSTVDIGAFQYFPGGWHGAGLDYDPTNGTNYVEKPPTPTGLTIAINSAVVVNNAPVQSQTTLQSSMSQVVNLALRFPSSDSYFPGRLRDVFVDNGTQHVRVKVFYQSDQRIAERVYGSVNTGTNTWYFSHDPKLGELGVNQSGKPSYLKSVTTLSPAPGLNLVSKVIGNGVRIKTDTFGGCPINMYDVPETNQIRVAYGSSFITSVLPTESDRSATNASRRLYDQFSQVLAGTASTNLYSDFHASGIQTWSTTRRPEEGKVLLTQLLENWVIPTLSDPKNSTSLPPPRIELGAPPNNFQFSSPLEHARLPR